MLTYIILKMGRSRPLFRLFSVFFKQYDVKKCPSSIQWWDLNPRPLEQEFPPVTTRPGLRNLTFY